MTTEHPLDSRLLRRIGGQRGSNPAALYVDDNGCRYYIKSLESAAMARNERMAAALYQLAGAPTLTYLDCLDPCQVATRWVDLDKTSIYHFSDAERVQAQQWLAVHAWTANWDAAGLHGDNQGVLNGQVITLDVGGALLYRASGDPKGKAFGDDVNELQSLRNDPRNPACVHLFGDISAAHLRDAIERITRISDTDIARCIDTFQGNETLVQRMLARKYDLQRQLS